MIEMSLFKKHDKIKLTKRKYPHKYKKKKIGVFTYRFSDMAVTTSNIFSDLFLLKIEGKRI